MQVFFLTSDLMFPSRVTSMARETGVSVALKRSIEDCELSDDTRLVIVDLGLRSLKIAAAVEAIRAECTNAKILAFGPHVDTQSLQAATEAGCDVVIPRSQFDQQVAFMLRELAVS